MGGLSMTHMVNMARTAEHKPEAVGHASPDSGEEAKYPYGLCLSLDDETLTKLGIEGPVSVGTEMMITAKVKVTSTSERESVSGGSEARMELQITDMEIGAQQTDLASKLYK